MKKLYSNPEVEIREYSLYESFVLTTSEPEVKTDNNLHDDDAYGIFGN